jgi:hypothetical protein
MLVPREFKVSARPPLLSWALDLPWGRFLSMRPKF